jgi:hypothetical protein
MDFEISRAKKERRQTIAYQKELIIEHDRLCAPDRISGIATSRLGLVRPRPDKVIYLERSDSALAARDSGTDPGRAPAEKEEVR